MDGELCPLARTQLQQILLEGRVPRSQLVLWSPRSMKMMLVIGTYISFCHILHNPEVWGYGPSFPSSHLAASLSCICPDEATSAGCLAREVCTWYGVVQVRMLLDGVGYWVRVVRIELGSSFGSWSWWGSMGNGPPELGLEVLAW